jgi:hypothetical protein
LIEELWFFDRWLKGIENEAMAEDPVTYYTCNLKTSDIGIAGWHTAKSWPSSSPQLTQFVLSEGSLSAGAEVPGGKSSLAVDYEANGEWFFEKGPSFVTAPLEQHVQITGHPALRLRLSSSHTDADVIARIDDVAPDSTSTYRTVEGRLRASLRKTDEPPYDNLGLPSHPFTADSVQPLGPGEPVELELDLSSSRTYSRRATASGSR